MDSNSNYKPNRVTRIQASKATKSRHAGEQGQGRAITEAESRLISLFGDRSFDNKGAERFFMSEAAMKRMIRVTGYTKQIGRLAGKYVVIAIDGQTVITVGHRYN